MNEMIERATGAANAARLNYDGVSGFDRTIALAVMRAMSGPTDEMIEAGVRIHKTPRSGPDETLVHDIWQEMCDEALGVD